MAFCPYCREIIGSNVTTCPSCGMTWQGQQQTQPQQAQGYQQPPPHQAPPPQNEPAYQPPPPQQDQSRICMQCGRQIPLHYNVCPHCGKQVTKQPTQQPAPQPAYQQPPPAYAPAPAYPPQPMRPIGKVGLGPMITAMIAGIMIIIGSFLLYFASGRWFHIGDIVDIWGNDVAYAWLIPIFGILVIVLAIIAYAIQNRAAATVGMVFGLLALLFALILPLHIGSNMDSIVDGFFASSGGDTIVYIGGFIAIFAGISAMSGCSGISKQIKLAQMPRYPVYPPQQPPYRPY